MDSDSVVHGRLLAEVLLLQRWAGGESVRADRIWGLMNGFESVLKQEFHDSARGISEEVQEQVEDLLDAIDRGQQSTAPMSIKDWLWKRKIDETDAGCVMQLCRLQSRFTDVVERIAAEGGSPFSYLRGRSPLPNANWFGALHYMELVDCSGDSSKKLHAVFAPSVPRIGEKVTPQSGQSMRVVEIEYLAATDGEQSTQHPILVPYVYLEPIDQSDADDSE